MTAFNTITWPLWKEALLTPYDWRVVSEDRLRHANGLELEYGVRPDEPFNVSLFLPQPQAYLVKNDDPTASFQDTMFPTIKEDPAVFLGHLSSAHPGFSESALQDTLDQCCGPRALNTLQAVSHQLASLYGPGQWLHLPESYIEVVMNLQRQGTLEIQNDMPRLQEVFAHEWGFLMPNMNGELQHPYTLALRPAPSFHQRMTFQEILEEKRDVLPFWVFEKP